MDDWIRPLRTLIALGLALLLVMLRLEAARFSAAEYDDAVDGDGAPPSCAGGSPGTRSGSALVAAILHRPPVALDGPVRSGLGDRRQVDLPRPRLRRGRHGHGDRRSLRYRYRRLRLPGRLVVPGRAAQRGHRPRSSTRSRSAAPSSALLLVTGLDATAANVIQAILYALATRLGAPGRDRYMLRHGARDRPRRRLGDGRSRAASPRRSSATRSPGSRCSCRPATPASSLPRGREVEEIEAQRRPPKGWQVIGPREPASRDR